MNKIYLLILVSNSILLGMDKPDTPRPKNVSFSADALDKLAMAQEAINT